MRWVFAAFVLALPMAVRAEPPAGANDDASVCTQGSGEAAIAACSRIVANAAASSADRAEAYLKRGDAIYSKGEYDRAIADYDEAIRFKPDLAKAFNNRGNAYAAKGQNDRAIADYDEAIRVKPDLAQAFYNRGRAYDDKGQHDRAIADYDQAIRLKPDYENAFNNRGVAYNHKGQYDRAIADYDQAIRLKPDDADAFYNRGVAYADKGQYDRAIADYDQAIRLKPDDAKAFNNRGVAYAAEGQYDRAIADYDQAIRLKPDYEKAFNNRGVAYAAEGQYDRAIADYDQAIRLKPDYENAFNNRGVAYAAEGQYDRAIADYDRAIRLKSDVSRPYANRGVARWEGQGDGEGAVKDLERSLTLDPSLTYARAKLDEIKTSLARRAASHAPPAPGSRVALVIANGDYGPNSLPNAVKDGEAIRDALEGLHYTVTFKPNLSASEMKAAITRFGDVDAPAAETSLIWYVGHGVSLDVAEGAQPKAGDLTPRQSDDFILGKDYRPGADPLQTGLFVSTLVDASQGQTLRMVVIDACRKLPAAEPGGRGVAFTKTPRLPDPGQGVQANPTNLLVVFSTQLGQPASDGTPQAGHSPFTEAFLTLVKSGDAKGVDPRAVFSGVKAEMKDMNSRGLIELQVPQVFDEQVKAHIPLFAPTTPVVGAAS